MISRVRGHMEKFSADLTGYDDPPRFTGQRRHRRHQHRHRQRHRQRGTATPTSGRRTSWTPRPTPKGPSS
ncbi:hypothetical protein [Nocardiopsis rhodophaea]|uniref:hypothetical protein n=1 Tax=Nocardiopsis rhodophaea TaxID=280238 RepID=UPI0031DFFC0A